MPIIRNNKATSEVIKMPSRNDRGLGFRIGVTNQQWFDTGIHANRGTRFVMDFIPYQESIVGSTNCIFMGSRAGVGIDDFTTWFAASSGVIANQNITSTFNTNSILVTGGTEFWGERIRLDRNRNVTTVTRLRDNRAWTATNNNTASMNPPGTMLLGAVREGASTNTTRNFSGTVFSCQIFEGDNLVRDFVPVAEGEQITTRDFGLVFNANNQWIDTGILASSNLRVETECLIFTTPSEWRLMYGARASATSQHMLAMSQTTSNVTLIGIGNGERSITRTTMPFNCRYHIIHSVPNGIFVNGINRGAGSTNTFNATFTMILGGGRSAGGAPGNSDNFRGIIFSHKIYDGNQLVCDFVPVQQGSTRFSSTPAPANCMWCRVRGDYFRMAGTSTIGWGQGTLIAPSTCMFDRVSQTFFQNQGTGQFTIQEAPASVTSSQVHRAYRNGQLIYQLGNDKLSQISCPTAIENNVWAIQDCRSWSDGQNTWDATHTGIRGQFRVQGGKGYMHWSVQSGWDWWWWQGQEIPIDLRNNVWWNTHLRSTTPIELTGDWTPWIFVNDWENWWWRWANDVGWGLFLYIWVTETPDPNDQRWSQCFRWAPDFNNPDWWWDWWGNWWWWEGRFNSVRIPFLYGWNNCGNQCNHKCNCPVNYECVAGKCQGPNPPVVCTPPLARVWDATTCRYTCVQCNCPLPWPNHSPIFMDDCGPTESYTFNCATCSWVRTSLRNCPPDRPWNMTTCNCNCPSTPKPTSGCTPPSKWVWEGTPLCRWACKTCETCPPGSDVKNPPTNAQDHTCHVCCEPYATNSYCPPDTIRTPPPHGSPWSACDSCVPVGAGGFSMPIDPVQQQMYVELNNPLIEVEID